MTADVGSVFSVIAGDVDGLEFSCRFTIFSPVTSILRDERSGWGVMVGWRRRRSINRRLVTWRGGRRRRGIIIRGSGCIRIFTARQNQGHESKNKRHLFHGLPFLCRLHNRYSLPRLPTLPIVFCHYLFAKPGGIPL